MPSDPKIRSSVPRPPVTAKSAAADKPAAKPAATAKPAANTVAAGYASASAFETARPAARKGAAGGVMDDSIGVMDDSIGVRGGSIGVMDDSIGVMDDSIGVRSKSIGVMDDSIGVMDDSIGTGKKGVGRGVMDDSIGGLGPEKDAEALRYKQYWTNIAENPRFLRPGNTVFPTYIGPANLPRTLATVAELPLTAKQKKALTDAASKDTAVGYRMDVVVNGTATMDTASRAALFGMVAEDPRGTKAQIIEHVVYSEGWAGLSKSQQNDVVKVFQAGGEKGMRMMAAMLEAHPDFVKAKASNGSTLLGNLGKLASQPLNAALYSGKLTQERLVQDVLTDIVNPDEIDQGSGPTCTVTSMMHDLVAHEPAEYARLMAELSGPSGKARMQGGGFLELQPGYVVPKKGDTRSSSEVMFQSAAMEWGNDVDAFDEAAGINHRANPKAGDDYRGLWPSQQKNLLQALFDVPYATEKFTKPGMNTKALAEIRKYDTTKPGNYPVILEIDLGNYNHAVNYEYTKNGTVHFRDPYGVARTMTEEAFLKNVCVIHLPRSLQQPS